MRGKYKTDIERIMAEALTAEGIEFIAEYPIRCKYGYILDFAIIQGEKKIDVETDGEIWHGGERDRKRDGYMRSHGWIILRFKGEEVRNDIAGCIARIKNTINQ